MSTLMAAFWMSSSSNSLALGSSTLASSLVDWHSSRSETARGASRNVFHSWIVERSEVGGFGAAWPHTTAARWHLKRAASPPKCGEQPQAFGVHSEKPVVPRYGPTKTATLTMLLCLGGAVSLQRVQAFDHALAIRRQR